MTPDASEVISSTEIDADAVVIPVWTHYELTKAKLENGKHVFVEKPFTFTAEEAEKLVNLAERKNLKIMVDHTFLFTGAVKKIRQLIDDGTLGSLYYYDSTARVSHPGGQPPCWLPIPASCPAWRMGPWWWCAKTAPRRSACENLWLRWKESWVRAQRRDQHGSA